MKKRYLYTVLLGLPGFFVSGIITLVLFGTFLGLLWIYVFGDDPWPTGIESMISALFLLVFLVLWIGLMVLGYRIGKGLEKDPQMNRIHILASAALTMLFILFIFLQQWSVGNLGPRSDTVMCGDFCARQGYAGSGMPTRNSGDETCSCYDTLGNEALKVPLEDIDLDNSK